ncbi:ATP-binding cassette domain-containing protein [bacterium D16-51]|nr:ATP-binding cassette domain-containing protein [bacterium D16-59]RKI60879.1 ATP-binding cassette domain-containing protein [bacterium D16-51]
MIKIEQLSKRYGKKTVVNKISLSLEPAVYGLLGPNGAGKTTLLRLLAGVICADSGSIDYSENCRCIGYLPQKFGCFPELTVYEQMEYFACLKKIPGKHRKEMIEKALEMVHMEEKAGMKCRKLSGGMVRRVGIAQAVLGRPGVVLFDEPTAGLDMEERIRFSEAVKSLEGEMIIVLSTHLVEDVKSVCKKVIIMNQGSVLLEETALGTAAMAAGKVFRIKRQEVEKLSAPYYVVRYETVGNAEFARVLVSERPLTECEECEADLEDGYFQVIKNLGTVIGKF